jgi:hypothetical protein
MKVKGWEGRLITYLNTVRSRPYKSSELDSAMFPAGAVFEMTGVDHAAAFRGKYKTIRAGKAMLKRQGVADYVELAAKLFDEHPSPLMAQRGDLVAVPHDDGVISLGIVQGERVYMMGLNGLVMVPVTQAVRAFKV